MSEIRIKFDNIPLQFQSLAKHRKENGRLNFYTQLIELYSSFDIVHRYFQNYLLTSVTSHWRNFKKIKFTSTDGQIYSWEEFLSPFGKMKKLLSKHIFYLFIDYHIPPSIPFWKGERDAYQKDGFLSNNILELIQKAEQLFLEIHLPQDFSFPQIDLNLKSEPNYWIQILDESGLTGKMRKGVKNDYLKLVEERRVLYFSLVSIILNNFEIPIDLQEVILKYF